MDCSALTLTAEVSALVDMAEARRLAGMPCLRFLGTAYRVPPGDGDMGCLPWMTEAEATRLHELRLALQYVEPREAAARLRLKIQKRRDGKL